MQPSQSAPRRRRRARVVVGLVVLAAVGAVPWTADRQLRRFLSALDEDSARSGERVARAAAGAPARSAGLRGDGAGRRQPHPRDRAGAEVRRGDGAGRPRGPAQVVGRDAAGGRWTSTARCRRWPAPRGLREVNLGASPAVKTGFDRPTSDVWTLPDQVQVVGLAPIRSGDQTPALLVKGLSLGESQLATVGTALGVTGALFIGERVAASSAQTPGAGRGASRRRAAWPTGPSRCQSGGRSYLVRLARTGDGATAARARLAGAASPPGRAGAVAAVSGLVPGRRSARCMLLILIVNARRRNGGIP